MIGKLMRFHKGQKGITGLETAIILIAFVVVASVFAYTVLSAGIFSSEKGKEAVYSGLQEARGSMDMVGSVIAVGILSDEMEDCDDAWTASTNVTGSTDTTDKKEGTASVDLVIDALFATGLVAYEDITSLDISDHRALRLWVKSDTTLAAGVLQLVVDETSACVSPEETLDLPALTADTWTRVELKMSSPSALDAVLSVGLNAASDPGAITVNVDLVEAPGEASQVKLVVSNALDGEAIDLATTSDADSDGILSDEATKYHTTVVTFINEDQRIEDITWTRTQLGKGDDDALLEAGEKMELTVELKALNPILLDDTELNIEVKPGTGSVLVIERTTPRVINSIMDLR